MQNVRLLYQQMRGLMERNLGVTEAREKFAEIVDQVQYQKDTVIINRHGKPAAAVVPVEVYEAWQRQKGEFFNLLRKVQEANPDTNPDEAMRDVLEAQKSYRSEQ